MGWPSFVEDLLTRRDELQQQWEQFNDDYRSDKLSTDNYRQLHISIKSLLDQLDAVLDYMTDPKNESFYKNLKLAYDLHWETSAKIRVQDEKRNSELRLEKEMSDLKSKNEKLQSDSDRIRNELKECQKQRDEYCKKLLNENPGAIYDQYPPTREKGRDGKKKI